MPTKFKVNLTHPVLSCRLLPRELAHFRRLAGAHGLKPADLLARMVRRELYKYTFDATGAPDDRLIL